ncbi:unnamed protein product [Caenorhabditis angaria]|uniref:Exocyst complex component 7 n=1 Tax=Caenorhabditis angaria TaxID=860376 RepID=A0A9P1I5V4_9PELO|nr:unnamed protein product [Caenorhabditis angaria]
MNESESIAKKLAQEEEWLANFKKNVTKSAQIREGIVKIVDKFDNRLTSLEKNVLPMHISNGQLQKKQHNIQRLINTIDATLQFYGKTSTVENAIRDGNPLIDLNVYLENMECLQQAINFFENHPNYASQTENMKMTLDTGFTILEKAYKTIIQKNGVTVDPANFLIKNQEGNNETPKSNDIKIIADEDQIIKLGNWLLKEQRVHFLTHYSDIRSAQILKNIKLIGEAQAKLRIGEASKKAQLARKVQHKTIPDSSIDIESCIAISNSLLTLLELEERFMVKAIPDTSRRAQVFRELVAKPLSFTLSQTQKIVNERDVGIIPLLPLLQLLSQNYSRFHNLATNSIGDMHFDNLIRQLQVKCSSYVNEAIENLNEDSSKFVPSDGNVHSTTASTLNFLSSLTHHRGTVTNQVLAITAQQGPTQLLLPKLFARILSALGSFLKKKANLYDDPTLSTIFLLNNYNYIAKTLADEKDGILPAITELNSNILSFYQEEINSCIIEYLKSWNGIALILKSVDRIGEDKQMAKNIMNTFVREFDQVLLQQTDYCISDLQAIENVQNQVKSRIWKNYSTLLDSCQRLHAFPQGIKYTENTFDMAIRNLFSSAKMI